MPEATYPLKWDETGERFYETGVDHGVLYPFASGSYGKGVAWNGLINVTEKNEGGDPTPLYADNIKYLNLMGSVDAGMTIESYYTPEEFDACDGTVALESELKGVYVGQQKRQTFGMSYRSRIGNDVDGDAHGYKLHLWYGCLASPSERQRQTVNNDPEAMTISHEVSTTPVEVGPKLKPASHIIIDSTKCAPGEIEKLEKILYGDQGTAPRLPMPSELKTIMSAV